MKKKPIVTFLKVMSIITLIWSVLGVLISAVAVFVAPAAEMATGEPVEMITWVSMAVSTVCMIVNFVLAIMALQHKGIGTAYRISTFTLLAPVVFNAVDGGGISGCLSALVGAVIPALFLVALGKQNKIDQEQ